MNRKPVPSAGGSLAAIIFGLAVVLSAIAPRPIKAQSSPILRLRPDGPLAPIHAMRFSPDGTKLFAGGDDKFVQVYDVAAGELKRNHTQSIRGPIGPGPLGTIQAMSMSSDGRFVVTGGVATFTQQAGFAQDGIMIPSFGWSDETLAEVGSVTLYDTRTGKRQTIPTHPGYVLATQLVTTGNPAKTFLVTIGNDEDPRRCDAPLASPDDPPDRSLRVFSIPDGTQRHRWPVTQTTIAPKLVAWSSNNAKASDLGGLRIAVTSADGNPGGGVDLYQPALNEPTRVSEPFALAAQRLGQTDQLCLSARRGILIVDGNTGKEIQRIDLTGSISPSEFIFAMESIESRDDLIAITTRDLSQPASPHRLNIVDLNAKRLLLAQSAAIGNRQNPVVAADPTGKRIVATADVTSGIRVFSLDRLAQGDGQPAQTLKPDYQPIRRAVLVPRGNGVGDDVSLRFSMDQLGKTATYDLIDDRLQVVAAPVFPTFDQTVSFTKVADKNEFVSSVMLDGAKIGTIKVESSGMPLAKVIRSDRLGGRPIVAVAYVPYVGETNARLSLYDPKTGKELRRLNGHEQFVTGIEFSGDDRHLTTVSADGMVCVWNLTDLPTLIGRRGAILDTRWCIDEEGIRIVSVEAGNNNGLRAGDRIKGIVNAENQFAEVQSPEDFFRRLSRLRPDSDATIRVDRGGQTMNVVVGLQQATDERKPLFSFICKTADDAGPPQWLAWTPTGPFQSSGGDIEKSAGWHFNPENPGDSVQFAPFDQYREQFSGDTLIENLLAAGRLPSVWPPRTVADVSVRFLDRKHQPVYQRDGQYRSGDRLARAEVLVTGTPSRSVSAIVGQIDDDRTIQFKRSPDNPELWQSDDANLASLASNHDIAVTVRSDRLLDGFQRETFDVVAGPGSVGTAAPATLPGLKVLSHVGNSRVERSDLLPGDRVRLEAIVDADKISADHRFTILIGDQQIELRDIEVVGNHVSATVPVSVGRNAMRLQLVGDGDSVASAIFTINVVDPIRIRSLAGTVVDHNIGRLEVAFESTRPVTRKHLRVTVDDIARDDFVLASASNTPAGSDHAAVIADLMLPVGQHEIQVETVDQNGEAWDRQSVPLVAQPQPQQPIVELSVAESTIVDAQEIDVAIQIESRDLESIQVQIGDDMIPVEVPGTDDDGMRLASVKVPLSRGLNALTVTAISAAGLRTSMRRQISRIDRPVGVLVDRFAIDGADPIEMVDKADGTFRTSSAAASATGFVEGRVRLASSDIADSATKNVIRASVNGFLQSVIPLKRSNADDEMTFRIPVTLSSTQNDIRLDLPGLIESENSTAAISIDCSKPSLDQTLHLLVISTRVTWRERKNYEKQVLDLLGVVNGKMPAFSRVVSGSPVYPAMTGEISRSDNIRPLIQQCRFELSDKQGINNTVLIYFHGEEMRNAEGQVCLMTPDVRADRAFEDNTLITSTYLASQLKDLKCANLLFLDVTPHAASAATPYAGDPGNPELGILRLVQSGTRRQTPTPELLGHISRVLPRVSQIGELAGALKVEVNPTTGLAVTESIPPPIRWMRFGALVSSEN